MANIRDSLLSSSLEYKIDQSWQIFQSHVFLVEVPVFFVLRGHSHVGVAELVASVVAHPYIVAAAGGDKSGCHIGVMDDPAISAREDPMLEKDC